MKHVMTEKNKSNKMWGGRFNAGPDALMEEINIISQRIEPQDCGHLNTTVRVLSDRVTEIKQELKND